MKPARVMIVEDEALIRRFVRGALQEVGCEVEEAADGVTALTKAGTWNPDLVVLDLGLPDRSGIDVIRDLRQWSSAPVLVLSARTDEDDKIAALDAGADDYLTKPFGVGELLARTRALLRRIRRDPGVAVVTFGEITLDLSRRTVTRAGEPVHLTPIEYRLLTTMASNSGRVLTQRQLLRDVWGPEHLQDPHYLRIYVANLRRKLEADPARPQHFLTETGIGYRFAADPGD